MKVLDLQCRQGHVFEGWFASEDDFQTQKQRELVQCPLCSDHHIEKRLSAPRLHLGARAPDTGRPDPATPAANGTPTMAGASGLSGTGPASLQAAWLQLARKIVAGTEDVGDRFAQEARRIHHGEVPERAIRGQATADEAVQLLEEGIAVVPVPLPASITETLQ